MKISDDLELDTEQSDVWYSEDEGICMTEVLYETLDDWVASAVDALTGELTEAVTLYNE